MRVGELRSLLSNYHDMARVVLVSGLLTADIDHVQVTPRFMAERHPGLTEAIEIHVGRPPLDEGGAS